jgi:hypothetical protein
MPLTNSVVAFQSYLSSGFDPHQGLPIYRLGYQI